MKSLENVQLCWLIKEIKQERFLLWLWLVILTLAADEGSEKLFLVAGTLASCFGNQPLHNQNWLQCLCQSCMWFQEASVFEPTSFGIGVRHTYWLYCRAIKEIMTATSFAKLCDFSNSKTGSGQLLKCEEKLLQYKKWKFKWK